MNGKIKTIAAYIESFKGVVRERLELIYNSVQSQAPAAEQTISYGMPAFKLAGRPLVYFAGYEHHIGLYALPSGHLHFSKELARFKQGKGSVQFPHDQTLPVELIKKIVKFRVQENLANAKQPKLGKRKPNKSASSKTKIKPKKK